MNGMSWFPTSLARRFALAAALLVAAALVGTSITSWWLINQQHDRALQELAARERQFRAAAVGSDLSALAVRMAEIAGSTILATGLVDSVGRETYLGPFLAGIRQINGLPVQVMLTDFAGTEIASNGNAKFSADQLAWLRQHIESGQPQARIFASADGSAAALVALEPMMYPRTTSPEGAVLYKVDLGDIKVGTGMRLEWGPMPSSSSQDQAEGAALSAPVSSPTVFTPLQFRVRGDKWGGTGRAELSVPYVHVLLISLTLFSAVVMAGITLTRLLTRDLQRLEAFSRQLFGSGLKTERAPEGGSDEVAGLAKAINGMLDRLHDQHADLLHEREKLTQLTEALQAADRNKDNFLAMLGHELRNPLAPISAGAELLRRIPDTDPRVMRTSEVISRQVRHMTKIINDLLDVSRVTRGLITLDKAVIDVAEIVSAAIEQVRPLIESRRHSLSLSVPDGSAMVRADRARLVQVVSNLLTNSARYTAEGGQLLVDVSLKADEVWISVQDNGAGIDPDLMPQIFDLFTQGTRTVDRHEGGLGLGLALVKNLVALHGGSVSAVSGGRGHGATFTVRLPRVQAPSPLAAAPDPHPEPTSGHWRIMVVDDNIDAAQTLAQLLTVEGHEVEVAHDGPAALRLAEPGHTDVFILDIGLPGMDGMEVARRLRAMPPYADAMLIALTGYGQSADRQKSAEARFDHHLVKPADATVLQNLLAGWSRPSAGQRQTKA